MKRRAFLQSTLGLGAMGLLGSPTDTALQWRERGLIGFGTTLSIHAAHTDVVQLSEALDEAVATIRRIESHMSLFQSDSAISRLNREGVLHHPPQDLLTILHHAQAVAHRSEGAFDITVQPLWEAFDRAAKQGGLPNPAEVERAKALVGWRKIKVSDHEIRFEQMGMGITLNGVAQGFAADAVKQVLASHGVMHALINTGEWSAMGSSGQYKSWRLGIADPHQETALIARIALDGRSAATSADNECFFSADHLNNHIFNPHTGYSPTELASVTVLSPSCAMADALTKVMFVAGWHQSLELAKQWDVDLLLVNKAGQWKATPGLQLLVA